jgi:hypothetical protein
VLAATTVECRASVDVCDVAEVCTGSDPNCPVDGVEASGVLCRPLSGPVEVCDVSEVCDGVSTTCPVDAFEPPTATCRSASDLCDAIELCTGSGPACPADVLEPSGTVCRGPVGSCDVAEVCDGSTASCPADALEPSGTTCRAAAGDCDVAEACTGSDPNCPADAFEPSTLVCRGSTGECDPAEQCTGSDPNCPVDGFTSQGVACTDDGNVCTDDECDGAGLCDHPNNTAPCDDLDACTEVDTCVDGQCVGTLCAKQNACLEGVCTSAGCEFVAVSDPSVPAPPADFIFIVDSSRSMRRGLKTWIPDELCAFPVALAGTGVDYRVAIVRFGTNRTDNPSRGPVDPDVLLPFTDDGALFCTVLRGMQNDLRHGTEAGTEAIGFALDELPFRSGVTRNILIYTSQDDDSPATSIEKREPPSRGPGCWGKPCLSRWLPFQQRIDAVASRLIDEQVNLHIVMKSRNRPSTYQYGDPACTPLPGFAMDVETTLSCLRSKQNVAGTCTAGICSVGRLGLSCLTDADCESLSLQAHLLGAGVCGTTGFCEAGTIGSPCTVDTDCAIPARAYEVPRSLLQADLFFPGFVSDCVSELGCVP